MKNKFMEAMDFRYACKLFDTQKKISDDDIYYLLEVAQKSPSAFGMEPWKFLIITNEELKLKIQSLCDNQKQISSCSHLIIILAAINNIKPESIEATRRLARREMPQEKLDFVKKLYANHLKNISNNDKDIYNWTSKQTFIPITNMMTAAAFLKIDSCPIERFNKEKIEKLLELDTKEYQLSLVLPFGYRAEAQSQQIRLPLQEIIKFIR